MSDESADSPIHGGILLTCMFELLPYDNSDRTELPERLRFPVASREIEGFLYIPSVEGGGCPVGLV